MGASAAVSDGPTLFFSPSCCCWMVNPPGRMHDNDYITTAVIGTRAPAPEQARERDSGAFVFPRAIQVTIHTYVPYVHTWTQYHARTHTLSLSHPGFVYVRYFGFLASGQCARYTSVSLASIQPLNAFSRHSLSTGKVLQCHLKRERKKKEKW
ncbi:unnamed protein product [Periconia digitata]|uniref:Uncharacterized protein n=1 Tax=Periconia digitata TaxID=1303443 RepID=A0A9W4UC00_9PLEO|nr:unnamed protein product [Periconia digitata]